MSGDIKLLNVLLLVNGIIFLLYERYLVHEGKSWIYYLIVSVISFILVSLMFKLSQKKNLAHILLVVILLYILLKFAFVSILSSPMLSLYQDAYVVYQVANSLHLGHIQPIGYYTGASRILSTMPVVPIFSYVVHIVAGYSLASIVKHLGAGVSSVFLPLSYGIVFRSLVTQKISNNWIRALLILIFSPWLLGFLVWGHYAIFSTVFGALLIWATLRQVRQEKVNKKKIFIIYVVTLSALVFTHLYLLLVFLVSYTVFVLLTITLENRRMLSDILNLYVLFLVLTMAYLVYHTYQLKSLIPVIEYFKTALFKVRDPSQGISYYGSPKASPMFVVVLKYLGVISLMILSAVSLGWYYLKSRVELSGYLLFFSIGISSVILVMPHIFYPIQGTDLFNRVFYLGTLSVSPYISYYFSTHLKDYKYRLLLGTMLTFVFLFGLLSATRPDIVDWNTPIVSDEDIRLNPTEWIAAGKFTTNIPTDTLYGLRLGVGPIRSLMRKNYVQLSTSRNLLIFPEELNYNLYVPKDKYIVLRLSMRKYPDKSLRVDGTVVYKLRSHINIDIIYSGSDVFIVRTG